MRQLSRRADRRGAVLSSENEGAEAPARAGSVSRGFCLQLAPVPSCKSEATAELMTARLGELVNAENGTYRPALCLLLRRACLLRVKKGRH